jgi:tetratricopeptide (TPR) repeat protein
MREEIVDRIWGKGVFIDSENAINTAVRKLRRALDDDAKMPRLIITVPSRGYRFDAALDAANEPLQVRRPRSSLVGRDREIAELHAALAEAVSGHGSLFLISGQAGIGKTRLARELEAIAQAEGMEVLAGHCSEHDEAIPYLPFVEILESLVERASGKDHLHTMLGEEGPELARLLPKVRRILPDLPPALDLPPPEARHHLFNSFCDFVARISREQAALLIVEDLQWADDSTLSLLGHLARRLGGLPLMVAATYRDAELDVRAALARTLEEFHRGRLATEIRPAALHRDEVEQMLRSLSGQTPPPAVVEAVYQETGGNPFFVEELFRHLEEENRLYNEAGVFRTELRISEAEAPRSVRLVVGRRLARLAECTQKMLATAATVGRVFKLELVEAAGQEDAESMLESAEEAEKAGLIRTHAEDSRAFEFSHELAQQAVLSGLSAARRQQLHLQVAEAIERLYYDRLEDHLSDLAHHYGQSLNPGKALEYLGRAADRAEVAYAYGEVVALLKLALELLSRTDARRPRLLGRLGIALIWSLNPEEALKIAGEAGDSIAAVEGEQAAADYFAEATKAMALAGFMRSSMALASHGLRYAGDRRDETWVTLTNMDLIREEADDPNYPGIPIDSPRRREFHQVLRRTKVGPLALSGSQAMQFLSRKEVLERASDDPLALGYWAGEYRRAVSLWEAKAARCEREGQIAEAVASWAQAARFHTALGDFAAARAAYQRGRETGSRLTGLSVQVWLMGTARAEMWQALDENWEKIVAAAESAIQTAIRDQRPEITWQLAAFRGAAAFAHAHLGNVHQAIDQLKHLVMAVERAAGWAPGYTEMTCDAASVLWLLERTEFIEVFERNIREKVVAPDFRFPLHDGRLSLAHLCALQGRYDEAVEWFAKSRAVLEEQGARPLRAIADLDEALMYIRRRAAGDKGHARALLDAAIDQFRSIGMTGWLRRAQGLASRVT